MRAIAGQERQAGMAGQQQNHEIDSRTIWKNPHRLLNLDATQVCPFKGFLPNHSHRSQSWNITDIIRS
jgi:hypothetical protein